MEQQQQKQEEETGETAALSNNYKWPFLEIN